MRAIYKKEVFSFYHSMQGYLYLAFFLLIAGIFFMTFNLQGGVAEFGYVLGNTTTILLIVIPMLTMRLLCEEQRQKTDQLLFTAPVEIWKIVAGKYLAVLTIFASPLVILALCPLILSRYGQVPLLESYSCFLAFLFMGAACLSIGLFVSSLTDHPILSAIGTFALLLVSYLMNGISGLAGAGASGSLLGISAVAGAGALVAGLCSGSRKGALGLWAAAEAVLGVCCWVSPSALEGRFQQLMEGFSLFQRYYDFVDGVFDLSHLVYYLGIIFLFLFLTIQSVEKRRRSGESVYALAVCVLAVAATVLVNLIAGQLPSRVMKYDTSSTELYSLSAQTKEIAADLDEPVSLYLIAPQGKEDETLVRLLELYEDLNSKITVAHIDPVLSPDFVSQYTSSMVSDNSILAVGESRTRVVRNSDLYPTRYDYDTGGVSSYFDGEGQITSAIRYVTAEGLSTLYVLSGHGESEITEEFQSALEKEGIQMQSLNLAGAGQVPEDGDCLFLNVPVSDLTKEEEAAVNAYLQNGGKMLLITGISAVGQPNLELLLSGYGLGFQQGMILETNGNYCIPSYPNFLLPQMSSDAITNPLIQEDGLVLLPNAHGIEILEDHRETVEVKALLKTSPDSYLKTDTSTLSYEAGDLRGPFNVMAVASEVTSYGETKIVWVSSSSLLTGEIDEMVGGNNTDLILNSLGWMLEQDGGISIRPKLTAALPLRLTASQANSWGILFVLVIPAAILCMGIAVCVKRRRQQ